VEALKYVDEQSEEVRLIGATNTIVNDGGRLVAHNTDGKGFVTGIEKAGVHLRDKKVTLLARAARPGDRRGVRAGGVAKQPSSTATPKRAAIWRRFSTNEPPAARPLRLGRHRAHPALRHPDQRHQRGPLPGPGCPDIRYEDIAPGMIVQDVIPNPADTSF
jgi:shikimate dehydrogenase